MCLSNEEYFVIKKINKKVLKKLRNNFIITSQKLTTYFCVKSKYFR